MGFKRKKKKSLKKLFSVRKLVITIVSKLYSYIVFDKYKKALKIDFENRVSDISKKI